MKADYTTPKCCTNPSVAVMDYLQPIFTNYEELPNPHVNRMCMKCYTHWAGTVDNVKQYTRKEWDEHVEKNSG